ncbi:MAG: hypothetical protein H7Z74_00975 [Anaerolineae bacterium]|nr:hypothetical protein [Gemmatimonadaceae bacterium]
MFDETLYLIEMSRLLDQAAATLRREYPQALVYTVSVWTDPDAAVSGVSFDTAENSAAKMAEEEAWAAEHFARLSTRGEHEEAKLFAPRGGARNDNPADFAFREIALVEHRSFPLRWAEEMGGRCWEELGPALERVRERAVDLYVLLPLDTDAELAVNSNRDWYDEPVKLRRAAI